MVRTIIVTIAAVCLTLLLLNFGTFVVLRTTDFGKVAMGDARGVADPWKTFMAGQNLLFWYLDLPITMIVSFTAAFVARRFSVAAGVLGTAPVSGILLAAGDAVRGFLLVACAAASGLAAMQLRSRGARTPSGENALTTKLSK